jgi:flagellar FliL protein
MSDEMFDQEDEAGGEEQPTTAGKKKIGFLPAIVIDILKWGAIVIGAIIFIVVTVVITVRFMGQGNQASATRLPLESAYEEQSAELLNEAVSPELIQRQVQIKELINMYFAEKTISELEGNENRTRIKRELLEEINRLMIEDVQEIAFDRYEFIEF